MLISSFFIGGLVGAIGFKWVGFIATLPLSVLLLALVWRPILHDAKNWIEPPVKCDKED